MSARPATRRAPTATAVRRPEAPSGPPVRDFASPAAGYTIEWDVRSVYDFLFSLAKDDDAPEDLPEADRTWLAEARAAMAAELGDAADADFAQAMAVHVAAVAVERPELRTVAAFLDAVDTIPTADLVTSILSDFARDPDLGELVQRASTGDQDALAALREAMPEHKAGFPALLADPAGGHRRIVRILRAWAAAFTAIEPRIAAIIERDHALRAVDRGALNASDLIERTTGGIRWLPEVGIRRVVLAPSYFSRPYNFLLAGDDWRFFGYPVADDALEPDDRLSPPPGVVRLHRALGDETRLRILKLLAGKDLYLTEIAQQLDLSKPTIKHHLALLRAAGLVTVVEAGNVVYYSLRRDRIEGASTDLARFLVP
jgi:DNA-binding transcriptional ArsR family regulator